jgi:hypothetical protein
MTQFGDMDYKCSHCSYFYRVPSYQWTEYLAKEYEKRRKNAEILKVIEKWFWRVVRGGANTYEPDLKGKIYTKEQVDKILKELDEDARGEIEAHTWYWSQRGIKTFPSFNEELQGGARLAMAQDLYNKVVEVFGENYKEGLE